LNVANIIRDKLIQRDQFPIWLETVFDSLYQEVRYPAILEVLKALHEKGARLLIINYDDLLEKFCNLYRIGWSNQDNILKFKNRDLNVVFYMYKNYQKPYKIILNITDYY
jgi:hypothetical protein